MGNTPEYSLAQRAHAISLWAGGKTRAEIKQATGYSPRGFSQLLAKAIKRGYIRSGPVYDYYLEDVPREGRPPILSAYKRWQIMDHLQTDRHTRSASMEATAEAVNSSTTSTWRAIKDSGLRSYKHTTKPGYTKEQKAKRFAFAISVMHWTMEEWQGVVWSDETSVQIYAARGRNRVWRLPDKEHHPDVVRRRWKGNSDFMFWSCYTAIAKGPCFIWPNGTAAMKKHYQKLMNEYNEGAEPLARKIWDWEQSLARLGLPPRPGKRPIFKFDEKKGAQTRTGKGGFDWIRYREEVLKEHFIPFVQQLKVDYPHIRILAQEDNAPAHTSQWCRAEWANAGIEMLVWPSNSPDLSAAEGPWFPMKTATSDVNKSKSKPEIKKKWAFTWESWPQEKLKRYVERVRGNVAWVVYLKGGNNYPEGTWPPHGSKEEPKEWWAEFQKKRREEYGDGSKITVASIPDVQEVPELVEIEEE